MPLADSMRPKTIDDVVGQSHFYIFQNHQELEE